MVARQPTAATHFPGQFSCKASGHGRALLAPTRVFASLGPKYSCPPHGSLPHRLRAAPRVEFSPFVGNVIRRGAFYMRPQLSHDRAPTGGRGPDMSGPYRMLTGPPHPNAYRSCSAPRSRSRSPGRGPPRGRRTRRAGRRPAQSKRSCRVWLRRCSRC